MFIVRRYGSELRARLAAAYLCSHDLHAMAVGGSLEAGAPSQGWLGEGLHAVAVPLKLDLELARALLEEFDQTEADPGWEDNTEPDLSRLDPLLTVRCSGCQYDLRGVVDQARCPECGETFDLLTLVVEQHGPEALDGCYDRNDDNERPQD
jgi:hypothetical protein